MTASAPVSQLLQQAALLERRGQVPEALQYLRRASSQAGKAAHWHHAIAQAAIRLGDGDLALSEMDLAVQQSGCDPALRFQYACLLAHRGLHARALTHFQQAADRLPGNPNVLHLTGVTLQRLGRNHEALAPLRAAHSLAPANDRILEALAESEFHAGHPDDALPLWEAVLALRPDDTGVLQRMAETFNRVGRSADALDLLRQATARQPQADELWMVMAQTAEDLGDRDTAREAYRSALELRPGWAFPVSGLLALDRGKASDELIEQARDLLARDDLPDPDRALIGYELGKALDGRERYAEAAACWHDANAARRRMIGAPDLEAFAQQAERVIAATRDLRSRGIDGWPGSDDTRPVFIVGMPRSGTTLTEQILASHPAVHGCGELPDLALVARMLAGGERSAWPELGNDLPEGELRAAAERYLRAATRNAPPGTLRLVDKAPLNFFHLDLIARLFPRAHVIWCRRDPRDIAVSVYGENFALEERLATSLEDIGHYINLQTRLMRHWQAESPLPVLELHYEELATAPEPVARGLIGFVGLPWDPACLEFHRSERGVQTPSRWQVKQPVHTRSIGRWRHYADHLGPLLQVLDGDAYPASTYIAAAGPATSDQASTPSS
mgnify:CR=1 FL=1